MNTKLKSTLVLAGFVLAGLACAQAQNLVTNGGFETTGQLVFIDGAARLYATPSEERYDFDTGWYTETEKVSFRQSGSLGVTTLDGGNFLTLESDFYQNYSWIQRRNGIAATYVTLAANTAYTISFDVTLAYTTADHTLLYWGLAAQNGAQLPGYDSVPSFAWGSWTGNPRFEIVEGDGGTHLEWSFTTTDATDYRLFFQSYPKGNVSATTESILALDNISITAAAVPEPATYAALFGAGVLGFTLWRRRLRRLSTREGAGSAASSVR